MYIKEASIEESEETFEEIDLIEDEDEEEIDLEEDTADEALYSGDEIIEIDLNEDYT